jgi:hypothetical protein
MLLVSYQLIVKRGEAIICCSYIFKNERKVDVDKDSPLTNSRMFEKIKALL